MLRSGAVRADAKLTDDMYTVQIGEEVRTESEVTQQWINDKINARRRDRQTVCVRVTITDGDASMTLSKDCLQSGGGSWNPNRKQQAIFELWQKHMERPQFTGGDLVAFLHQLSNKLL